MKLLRLRLELSIKQDEFGLHALAPETRTWLGVTRDNAKGHGFTVTVDPVEDAKGLRKVAERPRKARKTTLSVVPDVA